MKKYERLILIAIVAKFMGMALSPMVVQLFLPGGAMYTQVPTGIDIGFLLGKIVALSIENVGIAYWLHAESKNILWIAMGLIFGIPGLLAYYAVKLVGGREK